MNMRRRGNVLSTTVSQEVDVDVDFTIDEVVDLLKDNGYQVV